MSQSAYLLSEVGGEQEAERLRRQAELAIEQELPALLHDIPPDGVFHDLGCGSGLLAAAVARARPDVRVLATDLDPAAVAQAQKEAAPLHNLRVALAGLGNPLLDLPRADTACLRLVLMHVPDPVGALKGAKAWLKKGGHLHVIEGDDRSIGTRPALEWLPELLDLMERVQLGLGGSRRLGQELEDILDKAGYGVLLLHRNAPEPRRAAGALKAVFLPVASFYLGKALQRGLISPEQEQWYRQRMDTDVEGLQEAALPLFRAVAVA